MYSFLELVCGEQFSFQQERGDTDDVFYVVSSEKGGAERDYALVVMVEVKAGFFSVHDIFCIPVGIKFLIGAVGDRFLFYTRQCSLYLCVFTAHYQQSVVRQGVDELEKGCDEVLLGREDIEVIVFK